LSTAEITQRAQVHQTYLSQWVSPFNQPYQTLVATYEQALRAMGRAGAAVQNVAVGHIYQVYRLQASVLAYSDVFFYCAIVAFLMVPFCFLLSAKTGGGRPGGSH
jgi:DHA2 family multidrug resistance protein